MKMRSVEERNELVAQVDTYRAAGMTVEGACKKAGISYSNYYFWRDGVTAKKKKVKKSPSLVTIPIGDATPTDRIEITSGPFIMVITRDAKALVQALREVL